MHFVKQVSAAAAILAAAMLLLATASQERAAAQTKRAVQACVSGFTAQALSPAADGYVCVSAEAVCGMRPVATMTVELMPPLPTQNGVAFRYRCRYRPISASPR